MVKKNNNNDPFSMKNLNGVPSEMAKDLLSSSTPTVNAQERSQASPDTTEYKDGGKIPSTHKKHHSKKHIKVMKDDMKEGDSFKKAHKKAIKKVGK